MGSCDRDICCRNGCFYHCWDVEELESNLYEDNLERCVDFGHTFSPLLEMIDINNLLHGEAVSIDCAFSSCISFNRGYLSHDDIKRIFHLMKKLSLPNNHKFLSADILWESVCERTKHRGGLQRIPLPNSIGNYLFVNDIIIEELKEACEKINIYSNE